LEGLTKSELDSLADWERTFESKYEVVGRVSGRVRHRVAVAGTALISRKASAPCWY
jgi:hypothetical protein